jgi:two-component system KDP operon response regulator KdpE
MTTSRVLVVEDDLNVRRFIQMTLDPLEVELVHCGTLAEARRSLESAGASVVITDLSLPDGPGQDLLAWTEPLPLRRYPRPRSHAVRWCSAEG